ncbi:MAG: mechanosensitive ion channel domain-containing protein [Bacilli bacterium]|nr:mechanosensitive ion channel domain-containing protein [Bacilli bacterium]
MSTQTIITILTAIIVATVTLILQKSFSNIICGINLAIRQPFKKGDRVTIKYYDKEIVSGHVIGLGLINIKIKTYDKSVYIMPTNIVDTCVVVNDDYSQGINHTEKIKISLDSNINKAKTIILATILSNDNTENTNENTHIIIKYVDSGIEIQYNVRTNSIEKSYDVCSEICEHLLKVLNEQSDINII